MKNKDKLFKGLEKVLPTQRKFEVVILILRPLKLQIDGWTSGKKGK